MAAYLAFNVADLLFDLGCLPDYVQLVAEFMVVLAFDVDAVLLEHVAEVEVGSKVVEVWRGVQV